MTFILCRKCGKRLKVLQTSLSKNTMNQSYIVDYHVCRIKKYAKDKK